MAHYGMATAESFLQAIETTTAVAVAVTSLVQCVPIQPEADRGGGKKPTKNGP